MQVTLIRNKLGPLSIRTDSTKRNSLAQHSRGNAQHTAAMAYSTDAFHHSLRFGGQRKKDTETDRILRRQERQIQIPAPDTPSYEPGCFYNTFPETQPTIIGAGSNLYNDFLNIRSNLDILLQDASSNRSLYDPAFLRDGKLITPPVKPEIKGNRITNLNAIPKGNLGFILSPSGFHTQQIKALLANPNVTGIYCEKPMATNPAQLRELDRALKTKNKPIYFADHFYFLALPLLAVMGKPMPYKNLLVVEPGLPASQELAECIRTGKPVLKKVTKMEGKWLEPWYPRSLQDRAWLLEREKGGGVMLDLFIHIANLMNLMGLKLQNVTHSDMSAWDPQLGKDVPLANARPELAETYSHVQGSFGQTGRFDFEVGMHQPLGKKQNDLVLTDASERKLRLNYDHIRGDFVELLDSQNQVIGRVTLPTSRYLLMIHHALAFLTSKSRQALFYEAQKDALNLIFAAKAQALHMPQSA